MSSKIIGNYENIWVCMTGICNIIKSAYTIHNHNLQTTDTAKYLLMLFIIIHHLGLAHIQNATHLIPSTRTNT